MATVFILLAWAGWALLSRPVVGVADILDFWRVMRPAGIEHNTPLEYPGYFVRADFVTGDADLLSAPSSSAAMAWAARSCRRASGSMVLLWMWTTSQFGVAVLGEGFVNLHQHLVGARLGLDLLVVVMMAEYLRRRTS